MRFSVKLFWSLLVAFIATAPGGLMMFLANTIGPKLSDRNFLLAILLQGATIPAFLGFLYFLWARNQTMPGNANSLLCSCMRGAEEGCEADLAKRMEIRRREREVELLTGIYPGTGLSLSKLEEEFQISRWAKILRAHHCRRLRRASFGRP